MITTTTKIYEPKIVWGYFDAQKHGRAAAGHKIHLECKGGYIQNMNTWILNAILVVTPKWIYI